LCARRNYQKYFRYWNDAPRQIVSLSLNCSRMGGKKRAKAKLSLMSSGRRWARE
jgi:hypothetical protein